MLQTSTHLLQESPYISYAYAYPHKTAYRAFAEPLPLDTLWRDEKRDALFLYMHIPFCEMRCGFCNLFTTVGATSSFENDYIDALERQAREVRQALGTMNIARMAIGGGTPTHLSLQNLSRLFTISEELFGVTADIPCSVETSPLTADQDKLRLLREHGADRISIGVQSFLEDEAHAAGRAQKAATVEHALSTIREIGFPTLNIDLIYGLPGQNVQSWLTSLEMALRYQPEELYLYPLYVRPLTGLAKRETRLISSEQGQTDIRLECYRLGRELLLSSGYVQESMRMFRLEKGKHDLERIPGNPGQVGRRFERVGTSPTPTVEHAGPVYCTQDDGMVGLGCGARSYTRAYHYSNEYAVGAYGVRAILQAYINTPAQDFASAFYGFHLNEDEQHRRYMLKSLLEAGGLNLLTYRQQFGSTAYDDLPELLELKDLGLVHTAQNVMTLTAAGLERSDAIGPWLYSAQVQKLMGGYELR